MEDYGGYFKSGDLIAKYLTGELNGKEQAELAAWLAQSERNQAYFEQLTENAHLQNELERFAVPDKAEAWKRIAAETGFANSQRFAHPNKRIVRWVAAALVLLVSGLVAYFLFESTTRPQPIAQQEILPGGNKAVLTLANGQKITLDETTTGEITRQEGVIITQTTDGQLVYEVTVGARPAGSMESAAIHHTISTPRGGKFRLRLSDGSSIWLNAASSLKYPVHFRGKERKVELQGEAYFEITHVHTHRQEAMPFRVVSARQVVDVLGTHFNINSYPDERRVKTTLLEGKVKVTQTPRVAQVHPASTLILKPGEQAQLSAAQESALSLSAQANPAAAVAWKNGHFQFDDADLPTVMRQISRWYNVEVTFRTNALDKKFRGKISRDAPLSQIFQILQLSGVNFKIDGRKITVLS